MLFCCNRVVDFICKGLHLLFRITLVYQLSAIYDEQSRHRLMKSIFSCMIALPGDHSTVISMRKAFQKDMHIKNMYITNSKLNNYIKNA